MICIDDCATCKHERELKDGWKFCCDAFPDGTPLGFKFVEVKEKGVCNNGIGYEEKKDLVEQ